MLSAIERREDPTVEAVAHFWRGQPNDLALVGGVEQQPGKPRDPLHLRFWRTVYVTADGRRVLVGTVGVDESGDAAPGDAGTTEPPGLEMVVRDLLAQGATMASRIDPPGGATEGRSPSVPSVEAIVPALPWLDRAPYRSARTSSDGSRTILSFSLLRAAEEVRQHQTGRHP